MPRQARKKSESGIYHVILRGVNRQDIFYADSDKSRFVSTLSRFSKETGVEFIAYCLMSNHVHLLIRSGEQTDLLIKKIASSYVYYFNRKYRRVGHLFQDRFRSEAVDTDAYLLTVTRYILLNPQKAGISVPENYPWSSWSELNRPLFCHMEQVYEIAGGKEPFIAFLYTENDDFCLDVEPEPPVSEDIAELIQRITGISDPAVLAKLPTSERDAHLKALRQAGLSVRQLAALTGINRNVIQRL